VRVTHLLTAPVDDEIVILNPRSDNYIGLDAIGRAIWDLLETPLDVGALCERLANTFDATSEQIAADVVPFLEELVQEGLVRVVEA
jgi:hypothetical protein